MKRSKFIRLALAGLGSTIFFREAIAKAMFATKRMYTGEDKWVLHRAESRGFADHGWLKAKHTFSFADYYDPGRVQFGALRVLNDDEVAGGKGFGKHPHDNMEIITIPLEGDLEHEDSMGNKAVTRAGDVQVMSAGTGVRHSEYNANKDKPVKLLQIWVFPDRKQVKPRYDQITLKIADRRNVIQTVVSPHPGEQGSVWIYQQAWFHLTQLDKGKALNYTLKRSQNGLYVFVIAGEVQVQGQTLNSRDGFGIWEVPSFELKAAKDAFVLLMDVPMNAN
jgi:hypothetical protein